MLVVGSLRLSVSYLQSCVQAGRSGFGKDKTKNRERKRKGKETRISSNRVRGNKPS